MLRSLKLIDEGRTRLLVPSISLAKKEPPTSPIFYNPAARINRDISVAIAEVTGGSKFCDALCGIGARGVRIANELSRRIDVTMIDWNELSLSVARRNARINDVYDRCRFLCKDVRSYLYTINEKFDYIDIDPYGSPINFISSCINAASDGTILSITATDTAVLCGVYQKVTYRRYASKPINCSFKHEMGIRILLNSCRRIAGMSDLGIEGVFAHSTKHYIRVYFRIREGARWADRCIANEGYIEVCKKCNNIRADREVKGSCEICGSECISSGPLWIGPLIDESIAENASIFLRKYNYREAENVINKTINVNEFPPYSYSIEDICSNLKIPTVPFEKVKDRLIEAGFKCMRQPFEKTGIKTDADYRQVERAVNSVWLDMERK